MTGKNGLQVQAAGDSDRLAPPPGPSDPAAAVYYDLGRPAGPRPGPGPATKPAPGPSHPTPSNQAERSRRY